MLSHWYGLLLLQGSVNPPVPAPVPAGGIGHSKSKRVYLERDGKILVFAKPTHAAAWLAAEKHNAVKVETKQERPKKAIEPRKVEPIKQPEQVVSVDILALLVEQYRLKTDLTQLIQNQEYAAMISLYNEAMRLRDEEDIELLLLAA